MGNIFLCFCLKRQEWMQHTLWKILRHTPTLRYDNLKNKPPACLSNCTVAWSSNVEGGIAKSLRNFHILCFVLSFAEIEADPTVMELIAFHLLRSPIVKELIAFHLLRSTPPDVVKTVLSFLEKCPLCGAWSMGCHSLNCYRILCEHCGFSFKMCICGEYFCGWCSLDYCGECGAASTMTHLGDGADCIHRLGPFTRGVRLCAQCASDYWDPFYWDPNEDFSGTRGIMFGWGERLRRIAGFFKKASE